MKKRPTSARQRSAGTAARKPAPAASRTCVLRLYIADRSSNSIAAIVNLRRLTQEQLGGRCRIDIIDLMEDPAAARRDQILAVPTLIRIAPEPVRRVVGNLSHADEVLSGLDLRQFLTEEEVCP